LKPEFGAGAAAAGGAAVLPKLKTDEGAAGVEVAPPPKVNGLAPVLAAAGLDAADPKSKGDAAAVVTTGAAAAPKANGEGAAVAGA